MRNVCNTAGMSDRARAIQDGRVADVTLAVGAAALVTGVALLLVSSHAFARALSVSLCSPGSGRTVKISVGELWR